MKNMKRLICMLLVVVSLLAIVPVTASAKATLNKTSLTLVKGKTYQLKVSGTSKSYKWSSSNKKVATVTSKGLVKGVGYGTANIIATFSNGAKKKCVVKVVRKVSLSTVNSSYRTVDTYYVAPLIKVVNRSSTPIVYLKAKVSLYRNGVKKITGNYTLNFNYPYFPGNYSETFELPTSICGTTNGVKWRPSAVKLSLVSVYFSNGATWKNS